jgi:hypothetical protein
MPQVVNAAVNLPIYMFASKTFKAAAGMGPVVLLSLTISYPYMYYPRIISLFPQI